MKIKPEFIPLLENGTKTVELRKVHTLHSVLASYIYPCVHSMKSNTKCNNDINGRLVINLETELSESDCKCANCPQNKQVGMIIINGYEIVKKSEFMKWFYLINDYLEDHEFYDVDIYVWQGLVSNENKILPLWIINNYKWINEYWSWLIDYYFKDQEEILVLKIEKFKKNV